MTKTGRGSPVVIAMPAARHCEARRAKRRRPEAIQHLRNPARIRQTESWPWIASTVAALRARNDGKRGGPPPRVTLGEAGFA